MNFIEILEYPLINTDDFKFRVINLVFMFVILISARLLVYGSYKLLKRRFRLKNDEDEGHKFAILAITKYVIYSIALLLALANSGINITVLVAGSTALLVGLGFGIQNLFKDFVCGIILLFEGSLELGDVVETGGMLGKVTDIGMRTSKILTTEGVMLIVPNSKFIEKTVVNYTKHRILSRFNVVVGVSYETDPEKVRNILLKMVKQQTYVLNKPAPIVRLKEFAESGIKVELMFWTEHNFEMEDLKSDVRYGVSKVFREHGIKIPFPQRDLHIKTSSMPRSELIEE